MRNMCWAARLLLSSAGVSTDSFVPCCLVPSGCRKRLLDGRKVMKVAQLAVIIMERVRLQHLDHSCFRNA